jgi:hypothetical protein
MAEYDIVLQLIAPPTVDRDDMERHMMDVLQVVETHSETAMGPVVAVDFERCAIDLGFNVEASSPGESQRLVSDLLRIIEEHSAVQFTETGTRSTVAAAHEPVCV